MCTLLCKANTAKQRVERGAGGQAGGRAAAGPAPSAPSSVAPNTGEAAASDNTNSTMIGSDGSRSAARGAMIVDCLFFFFLSSSSLVRIKGVGGQGEW